MKEATSLVNNEAEPQYERRKALKTWCTTYSVRIYVCPDTHLSHLSTDRSYRSVYALPLPPYKSRRLSDCGQTETGCIAYYSPKPLPHVRYRKYLGRKEAPTTDIGRPLNKVFYFQQKLAQHPFFRGSIASRCSSARTLCGVLNICDQGIDQSDRSICTISYANNHQPWQVLISL